MVWFMVNFPGTNPLFAIIMATVIVLSSTPVYAQKRINSTAEKAGFTFKNTGSLSQPIIQFQQHVHMLAHVDDRPTVKVYGDGRVAVHYPGYMKKAGDYEMQLSDAELQSLIQSLSQHGVMDFDRQKNQNARKEKRHAMKRRGEFRAISDTVETVIEVNLDEYQKNSRAKKQKNFHQRFSWDNIEHDAKRFRDIPGIVNANRAVENMRGMMKDQRLKKRNDPGSNGLQADSKAR